MVGERGVCGLYTASLTWKAIPKRWRMKTNEAEEWEPPEDRLTSWWACERLTLSAAGAMGDALQNTGLKKGVIHPWLPSLICQELPRGWSAPCTSRCVTESEQLNRSLQLHHQEAAESDTYRVTKWDAHCLYLGIAGCHSTGLSKKVNLQGWQGRAKMHPRHFYGLVLAFLKLWMGRVPHDQISQSSPDSNTEDSKKKKKISIPLHPSCSTGSGTHAHLPGNFAHQILPNSMNLQLRLPRDPQSSLVFSLSSIHTTASRSLLLHCPSSCFNLTMEFFSWSGCS